MPDSLFKALVLTGERRDTKCPPARSREQLHLAFAETSNHAFYTLALVVRKPANGSLIYKLVPGMFFEPAPPEN